MGANTAAGVSLYIGTTALNAATDSYTEVGEVISIPSFGRTYDEVKYSPLSSRGVQKFKGSFDDGSIAVQLGKDAGDAGQALLAAALNTDFDYNFKVVANDAAAPVSGTVTVTVATPGVLTLANHGFPAGTQVLLSTTGALPTGFAIVTPYYVVAGATLTTNTFTLAATQAAALAGTGSIATTGAGTGTNTVTTVPAATTEFFKAKVTSYTTVYGTIDNIVQSVASLSIQSGSLTETPHLP